MNVICYVVWVLCCEFFVGDLLIVFVVLVFGVVVMIVVGILVNWVMLVLISSVVEMFGGDFGLSVCEDVLVWFVDVVCMCGLVSICMVSFFSVLFYGDDS